VMHMRVIRKALRSRRKPVGGEGGEHQGRS
jgi:hypothetical protein